MLIGVSGIGPKTAIILLSSRIGSVGSVFLGCVFLILLSFSFFAIWLKSSLWCSLAFKVNSILREVLYVAPKSPILELLKRMRSSRIHMGLVVDEFGGVDGLVTIEDLVEEIVGEIEDEHDAEDLDELIITRSKNFIVVDAAYKIEDLEKSFDIKINKNFDHEIDTLGGLIFSKINRVPKNNEIFDIDGLIKIKIIKASERKIITLEVKKVI